MAQRSWQTLILAGVAGIGLSVMAGTNLRAQEYGAAIVSGDQCFDDCAEEGCERPCCCFGFCNKLRLHCAYYHRRCQRPYVRLNAPPAAIAPFMGNGTWGSPGYGGPAAAGSGAYCPPGAAAGGPAGYSFLGTKGGTRPQGPMGAGYRPASPQMLPASYDR